MFSQKIVVLQDSQIKKNDMKHHLSQIACLALMFLISDIYAQPSTWDHEYSFTQSNYHSCFTKMVQTGNNELYLAGYDEYGWFESSPGFMKIDTNGVKSWSRGYNFPSSYQFITYTLVQTSVDSYYSFCFNPLSPVPVGADFKLADGETENDARLLKLNNDGDTLFSKHTQEIGWVSSMIYDDDKLFAVGSTNYYDTKEFGWQSKTTLLVLDTNGMVIMRKEYLDTLDSRANTVVKTQQGSYLIAGTTTEFSEPGYIDPEKMFLMEVDNQGNVLWEYLSDIEYSEGKEICICDDGTYALIGDGLGLGEDRDIILWKFDNNNVLTHTSFSGLPSADQAFGIMQTNDEGFIICGSIISQSLPNWIPTFLYLKTDAYGTEEWHMQNLSYYNCAYDVILNHNSGYYIAGDGHQKARLVKANLNGMGMIITSLESPDPGLGQLFEIYPNPGTDFITVKRKIPESNFRFLIRDVFGHSMVNAESRKELLKVNTSSFPCGLYFYEISNADGVIHSGKWIKQ